MKAVLLLALLAVGVCFAASADPVSQAQADWVVPEEKIGHQSTGEQSDLESQGSLLETQAKIKAQAAAEAKTGEGGDSPSWILPLAPAGYGGPGVINPYSNVNPLNPMAAQMQAEAAGQFRAGPPQTQMGPAYNNNAPVQPSFVETGSASKTKTETASTTETKSETKRTVSPIIEEVRFPSPIIHGSFMPPPFMATERGLPTSLRMPFPFPAMSPQGLQGINSPIVERMDISFSIPHSADDYNWPVVNGVVREHIEITKLPRKEEEPPAVLASNIGNMLTGMLRELVSGRENIATPAKLEVVELPRNDASLGGILHNLVGGPFTIEPELLPESEQPTQQETETIPELPLSTEAEQSTPVESEQPTITIIEASPTEPIAEIAETSETAEPAPAQVVTEADTQPEVDLPDQIQSEASALLNALVNEKAQEAVDEINKALASQTGSSESTTPSSPALVQKP